MATWNVLNRANQTFLHAQEACHTGIITGDYRPECDIPRNLGNVSDAAIVAVPALRSVLPRAANNMLGLMLTDHVLSKQVAP